MGYKRGVAINGVSRGAERARSCVAAIPEGHGGGACEEPPSHLRLHAGAVRAPRRVEHHEHVLLVGALHQREVELLGLLHAHDVHVRRRACRLTTSKRSSPSMMTAAGPASAHSCCDGAQPDISVPSPALTPGRRCWRGAVHGSLGGSGLLRSRCGARCCRRVGGASKCAPPAQGERGSQARLRAGADERAMAASQAPGAALGSGESGVLAPGARELHPRRRSASMRHHHACTAAALILCSKGSVCAHVLRAILEQIACDLLHPKSACCTPRQLGRRRRARARQARRSIECISGVVIVPAKEAE